MWRRQTCARLWTWSLSCVGYRYSVLRRSLRWSSETHPMPSKSRPIKQTSAANSPQSRKDDTKRKVALFIDGAQIGPLALRPILKAVGAHGSVHIRRIYLDGELAAKWNAPLMESSIQPVVVAPRLLDAAGATCLHMAMDIAELALRDRSLGASAIAVASQDCNVALVLRILKSWGLEAFLVVREDEFTERANDKALKDVVEKVIAYEVVEENIIGAMDMNRIDNEMELEEASYFDPVDPQQLLYVKKKLAHLGYMHYANASASKSMEQELEGPMLPGIAKLFHVNQLGRLTIYPQRAGFRQAYDLFSSDRSTSLKPNPGNLVYIEPSKTPSANIRARFGVTELARLVGGGGPFLLQIGPDLVQDVLAKLGFIESGDLDEAVDLFFLLNQKALTIRGVAKANDLERDKAVLHCTFSSQYELQRWLVPYSDAYVLKKLVAERHVASANARREEVLFAMQSFVRKYITSVRVPSTYVACVTYIHQHYARLQNPNMRQPE